jgi:hypothetical protein
VCRHSIHIFVSVLRINNEKNLIIKKVSSFFREHEIEFSTGLVSKAILLGKCEHEIQLKFIDTGIDLELAKIDPIKPFSTEIKLCPSPRFYDDDYGNFRSVTVKDTQTENCDSNKFFFSPVLKHPRNVTRV